MKVLPLLALLLLSACGKENPIVGKWHLVSPKPTGGEVEMMLNNDGSATRVFRPSDATVGGTELDGKYKFTDGNIDLNLPTVQDGPLTHVKGALKERTLTLHGPKGDEVFEK